jgi:hypothetical protein
MNTQPNNRLANFAHVAVLLLLGPLLVPGSANAQGDGPHNLPVIPVGMNLFVVMPMGLSGNFNPSQTVLIPGASVDVIAVPIIYIRTFSLGSRFGRLFVTAPLATLEANAEILDPIAGKYRFVDRRRSGWMDPMVTLHVGLVGAPALKPMEFMKHPKSFQMVGILGTGIPIGTYDSSRAINLGTNRWAFRLGVGTVTPLSKSWAWEAANTFFLFTENSDVFGPANTRSQDPLFVSENHVTYAFNPKWWASADLRWQVGGETSTDGVPDDNLTNILGGGATLGHQFSPHFTGYFSYGTVLAKKGDAKEWLVRGQIVYSF